MRGRPAQPAATPPPTPSCQPGPAPVHFLVLPRHLIASLEDVADHQEELLGHLVRVAGKVAGQMGLSGGYRLVINNGREGGQSVDQLHIHVMLSWGADR